MDYITLDLFYFPKQWSKTTAFRKSANKKSRENLQKKEKNEVIEKGYNKLGHHLSAGLEEISNDAYAGDSGVDSVGFSSLASGTSGQKTNHISGGISAWFRCRP